MGSLDSGNKLAFFFLKFFRRNFRKCRDLLLFELARCVVKVRRRNYQNIGLSTINNLDLAHSIGHPPQSSFSSCILKLQVQFLIMAFVISRCSTRWGRASSRRVHMCILKSIRASRSEKLLPIKGCLLKRALPTLQVRREPCVCTHGDALW